MNLWFSLSYLVVLLVILSELLPPLIFTLQVAQFLVGLNDVYASVRTNILLRKPMQSLGEVYNLVLQDEQHRRVHSISPLGSNLTSLNVSDKPSYGFGCGHVSGPSSGGWGSSSRGGWRDFSRTGGSVIQGSLQPGENTLEEAHSLTKDQYNRLLLGRSDIGNSAPKTGLITRPFNEQISGTW